MRSAYSGCISCKVLTLSEGWGRIRGIYSEEDVADIIYDLRLARKPQSIAASHQLILQSIELFLCIRREPSSCLYPALC